MRIEHDQRGNVYAYRRDVNILCLVDSSGLYEVVVLSHRPFEDREEGFCFREGIAREELNGLLTDESIDEMIDEAVFFEDYMICCYC